MTRARGSLEAFGIDPSALNQLANYRGDVTIGPAATKRSRTVRRKP
jgi:hypothetical protein